MKPSHRILRAVLCWSLALPATGLAADPPPSDAAALQAQKEQQRDSFLAARLQGQCSAAFALYHQPDLSPEVKQKLRAFMEAKVYGRYDKYRHEEMTTGKATPEAVAEDVARMKRNREKDLLYARDCDKSAEMLNDISRQLAIVP